MKDLLKRIYINTVILFAVYTLVWLILPGDVPFDYLDSRAYLATLVLLVGIDYLHDFIDKIISQRGGE